MEDLIRAEHMQPDLQTSQCIACKEAIKAGATVCSKCKSYQAHWKNYLQYAASVVGIFTVSVALLVYIISKVPDLKKILFWSDGVRIISFTYPGNLTVLNVGDGKILISHVTFHLEKGSSGTLSINKTMDAGEILAHQIEPEEQIRIREYTVISRLTPQDWNQKVGQSKSPASSDACVIYTVLYEHDPLYLQFKNHYGEGLQSIGATASIHFLSLHKREVVQQLLPVRSLLLQNPDNKCAE